MIEIINAGGLAQSEERNVSNVEAPGSKPGSSNYLLLLLLLLMLLTFGAMLNCLFSLVGRALA